LVKKADNLIAQQALALNKRSFSPVRPVPRKINHFAVTQTPAKTFAVLAGFCRGRVSGAPVRL